MAGESRTAHTIIRPMCGARVSRSDTKAVRGLTTKSKDPCIDCVIAEISRAADREWAAEGGDR